MICFLCKGTLEKKNTTFKVEMDGQVKTVKDVPSYVCSKCGQISYSDEVAKQIVKAIHHSKPKTFADLMKGFEDKNGDEYEYKEWDTGKLVGNEDIYNNPEYMERLLESKKQLEEGKGLKKELIDE